MFIVKLLPTALQDSKNWKIPVDLIGGTIGFVKEEDLDKWMTDNFPSWSEGSHYQKVELQDQIINTDSPVRTLYFKFNGFMANITNPSCKFPPAQKVSYLSQLIEGKIKTGQGNLQAGISALTAFGASVLPFEGTLIDRGVSKKIEHLLEMIV